ncbi:MAG: PilC/PilY family type IV pilus protein, partial [Myxococcota bacterium]|nr:PilC/PilY family type IV pilus protein [Myxococcota bacterium]
SVMGEPCTDEYTYGDTGMEGAWSADPDLDSCLDDVLDAIDQITQHFDWARYGVVGTASSEGDASYTPIAPLGSSYAEISEALENVEPHEVETRNLAETLVDLTENYLGNSETDNETDDDDDGFEKDWSEAPIEYSCQDTHIITISRNRPRHDDDVSSSWVDSISDDVTCTDSHCYYDNVVSALYDSDVRSDLSDDQNVTVHTLGVGYDPDVATTAESLFQSASDVTGGEGLYTVANTNEEIVAGIVTFIQDLQSGYYARSSPVISADGAYMIYAFYEMAGDNPLAEGHVRGYEIDDDPTSSTYGQVQYDGDDDFGGAIWDAGDLLVSRPVTSAESNPDDRDGFGKRDIYTFFEDAATLMSTESSVYHRQGFDYEFVYAVGTDSSVLDLILDTTSTVDPPCADDGTYDLNYDCMVDSDDLQALVDFARGLPEATYRYYAQERGNWKLGDSPHSVPVVVSVRNETYTIDPSYRAFLQGLEAEEYPSIVLIAANDGMLHAFALEDDADTSDSEEGEELWAWVPGYLLYREHDSEWAGRLVDMMLYGRTFLFDGTPVVEDVWIDADGDGFKSSDGSEWRRIVVVQQGKGGPVTLALDITDPTHPEFLWEQTDETDSSAQGYTVGRPTVVNIYDAEDEDEPHDRWVAMWGGGRAVPYSESASYYKSSEANLYMWHVGDDYWGSGDVDYSDHGDNDHPEADYYGSTLDVDSDGEYEYGYIAAALAVVDTDSDGDADTVYFPVTVSYTPTDEGGVGPYETADPGSTWMYKAC